MQSNMDFSVEGSVSANCHGWQNNASPIGNHIEIIKADFGKGLVVPSKEQVRAMVGGWGLCGRIHGVRYYKIPNWQVLSMVDPGWAHIDVGADYSHADMLNIHLDPKWQECIVNLHYYLKDMNPVVSELKDKVPWWVPLMVRFFPALRWFAQKNSGLHVVRSRNELLFTSVYHFEWPGQELAEYFVPTEKANQFVVSARPLISKLHLYNTTVRDIQADRSSMMPYAKGPTRGFVMLMRRQGGNPDILRSLVDLAISLGGSYYLPYNQYATVEQFRTAYPNWSEFRKHVIISNSWSKKYLGI